MPKVRIESKALGWTTMGHQRMPREK